MIVLDKFDTIFEMSIIYDYEILCLLSFTQWNSLDMRYIYYLVDSGRRIKSRKFVPIYIVEKKTAIFANQYTQFYAVVKDL